MKRGTIIKAKPQSVLRLARWLKLRIDGMRHKQIASLVYWRITRNGNNRH